MASICLGLNVLNWDDACSWNLSSWKARTHLASIVSSFNTLRLGQNGRHFADNTFKCIVLIENVRISMNISLKIVPKAPINNIPSLVQIMAWCRPGNKPLSEPMMIGLPTHIYVTRPQWINDTDLIFQFIWSIQYLLMPWLLQLPGHQQAW